MRCGSRRAAFKVCADNHVREESIVFNRKIMIRIIAPVFAIAVVLAVLLAGRQGTVQQDAAEPSARTTASVPVDQPASRTLAEEAEATLGTADQERAVLAQNDTGIASERFQLGRHYQRLSPTQPTSSGPDQIEVAEVFWYGCPHCFTFEPYLENWKEDIGENVSFVRVPAVWNPLLQLHARAYYAAEILGVSEEIHSPIFREIHINGNLLNSEQALQDFFERFGVGEEDFVQAFNSFAVHTRLQRADELSRRYRISSVPTIIVNGKYSATTGSAGDYAALMDLINELVESEDAG